MAAELRLEALLDEPIPLFRALPNPERPSIQLPPIQGSIPSHPTGRPSPLEPNASASGNASGQSHSKGSKLSSTRAGSSGKAFRPTSQYKSQSHGAGRSQGQTKHASTVDKRDARAGPSTDTKEVAASLRREGILNDHGPKRVDLIEPAESRKKQKIDPHIPLDGFVHLPKLPAKSTRPSRMPAVTVLNDLKTPPPNAGRFPPIAPGPFGDNGESSAIPHTESSLRASVKESRSPEEKDLDKPSNSSTQHKPRRKWSEQETKDLMRGVAIYGMGNWKKILTHEGFNFNARSSGDLKDRFRTCCPWDYRDKIRPSPEDPPCPADKQPDSMAGPACASLGGDSSHSPTSPTRPKAGGRSRAHRLEPSDLLSLGISGPFQPPTRRVRKGFTAAEDAALLQGYATFGPSWTKIQADPVFNFADRQPTDLRDRFRNRFPEKYAKAGYKVVTRSKQTPRSDELGTAGTEPPPLDSTSNALQPDQARESVDQAASSDAENLQEDLSLPSLIDWDDHANSKQGIVTSVISSQPTTLAPFPSADNDLSRLLITHISPLLTTYNPPSALPLPRSQYAGVSNTVAPAGAILPRPSYNNVVTSTQGMNSSKKSTVSLPPPTDLLLPMDLDVGLNNGPRLDKRNDFASTSIAPLLWEDIATHPMFDFEGDNSTPAVSREGAS